MSIMPMWDAPAPATYYEGNEMSKKDIDNAVIYMDKDPEMLTPEDILVDAKLSLPAVKRMIKLYRQHGLEVRGLWGWDQVE